MAINLNSLGNATAVPQATRTGNSTYSIVIVCSENNGKRITLTKALTTDLGVPENGGTLYITLYKESRSLVISTEPICNESITAKANVKAGKATLYVGMVVSFLIEAFGLADMYSSHVSHSFNKIKLDTDGTCRYAVVLFN